MTSPELGTKAIEVHERQMGDATETGYRKDHDGLDGDGSGSLAMVNEQRVGEGDEVDPEVLQHAIEVLEKKKTAWYAYLTTLDFWFVLLLGYVCVLLFDSPGYVEG